MTRYLISALILSVPAWGELVSTGVGIVRSQVVTSREVQIQNLLETAVSDKPSEDKLKMLAIDSKAFSKAVQDTLLESVIAIEAQNFNVVQLSPEESEKAQSRALAILKKSKAWNDLQVTPKEMAAGLTRKLQAKKFVQFRAASSVLPVTDLEAEKYFNENRLKFGNLPFANFKENIKTYLSRNQVDRRLKDWYEVLLSKYQVKNLIAEI